MRPQATKTENIGNCYPKWSEYTGHYSRTLETTVGKKAVSRDSGPYVAS